MANWQDAVLRAFGTDFNQITKADVSVTDSATELFNLNLVPGVYRIFLKNIGATALDSCAIEGRNSLSAAWVDVVSTTAEFTTIPDAIAGFLKSSDDTIDPTALTAGQEWNGSISTPSFRYVRMVATVASGSTTIKVEVN
jgi:hypothetical protein